MIASKNKSATFKFESLLECIFNTSKNLLAVINLSNWQIEYINQIGTKFLGSKKTDDLIGKKLDFFFSLPISLDERVAINKKIEEQKCYYIEIAIKGHDIKQIIKFDHFSEGKISYAKVEINEEETKAFIDNRKISEQSQFISLLDYAAMAIIIVNKNQELLKVNQFANHLFGYEPGELDNKSLDLLIPKSIRQRHKEHHNKYYKHPENRQMGIGMELNGLRKDGTEFPVEISLGTFSSTDETYVIAFIIDITKRKQNQQSILKLNNELEQKIKERTTELDFTINRLEAQINQTADKEIKLRKALEKEKELSDLKTKFISIASHEFKTPLSTILSSTYLLQQYKTTSEQIKRDVHIQRIIASVNMLTDTLNDFLSLERMEEGKSKPKFILFDINVFIKNILFEIKAIQKKGQRIFHHHFGDNEANLDPSLLKHILMNLLSNAIKFSGEQSSIYINIENTELSLIIQVKDHGIGIPVKEQLNLFDRFFRASNAEEVEGTGLGLHIVEKYVQLMEGNISFKSQPNMGTEFNITFNKDKSLIS